MRVIRTFRNLTALQEDLSFPKPLVHSVSELFEGLYQGSGEQPIDSFELDSLGSVVVLEPGERITPILESVPFGPEFVEKTVVLGSPIYRIGCLFDNDLIAQYVVWDEWLDEHEKQLLAQFEGRGGDSDE